LNPPLITVLLHGGGLRESEPFHLYVSDVAIDPRNTKSALVRLYHPERGKAPEDSVDLVTRKALDARAAAALFYGGAGRWEWRYSSIDASAGPSRDIIGMGIGAPRRAQRGVGTLSRACGTETATHAAPSSIAMKGLSLT